MTVDKPPLALWVQALSARLFGFHPLEHPRSRGADGRRDRRAGLRPDAAHVGPHGGLRRRARPRADADHRRHLAAQQPGRAADALLRRRALVPRARAAGRPHALARACGVCVGLGFETKMAAALLVVPAFAAAWLWVAPRGRLAAVRQLLAGGAAMVVVGGAWPLLMLLTPASNRPWMSGTSDNSILSLIFGYNGLGRLDGQAGGPAGRRAGGGGGGGVFGGDTGPLRLLNVSLGGQVGWLLGVAVVARGARGGHPPAASDRRTGWLLATGGAFVTTGRLQLREGHLPSVLRGAAGALQRGADRRRVGLVLPRAPAAGIGRRRGWPPGWRPSCSCSASSPASSRGCRPC